MSAHSKHSVETEPLPPNKLAVLGVHTINSSDPHHEQVGFRTLAASNKSLKTSGTSPR